MRFRNRDQGLRSAITPEGGSWEDKVGGSVIYGWGMRNGSVEDIERIILLVSKNRHVVGVFIPTNPSPNSLLILDTNITILISTSIKEFLQQQVHSHKTLSANVNFLEASVPITVFCSQEECARTSWRWCIAFAPCLSAAWAWVLLLSCQHFPHGTYGQCCFHSNFHSCGCLCCHLCGHHPCFHAWFWAFHQPGPWTMAAEMLQMVLCTWARVMGMNTCFGLTWPGAMIRSVSPSQTVGIVRVWEALGLHFFFFFLLKIVIIIFFSRFLPPHWPGSKEDLLPSHPQPCLPSPRGLLSWNTNIKVGMTR